MMKRIICLLLVCITLALIGCDSAPVGEFIPTEDVMGSSRFQEIGREAYNASSSRDTLEDAIYYVDKYTNIVYIYVIDWDGNATRGMMTVLYNAEGRPMTLTEFEKEIR